MASEFLVDGDLFVEVVDNTDGGGIPPQRLQTLSQAHATAALTAPLFHLSVPTAITACVNSTAERDLRRTSFVPVGAAASILSLCLMSQARQ